MSSQPVTRIGDKSTGDGPYPPRASTGGSGDVKVNNIGVVRVGDAWAPHNGGPNGTHKVEVHHSIEGSGTVNANGKALVRIGDKVDSLGDVSGAGSSNVFAG